MRRGDNWRTLEKYAYILLQWYDYLRVRNIPIFDATEDHLHDFLLGGGSRYGNVTAINRNLVPALTKTNVVKMKMIVSFYDYWERKRGVVLRAVRGLTLAQLNQEFFDRLHRSISKTKINFSKAEAEKDKRIITTPTPDEIEVALDESLKHPNDNRGQTWYLIGSLARRSGSRSCGIATLEVPKLMAGLEAETFVKQIPNYKVVLKEHLKEENRSLIVAALQKMLKARRSFVLCNIKAKGGEWVPIAIPIELCVDIIDYICNARKRQIDERFKPRGKKPPPNVFLSFKIGGDQLTGALTPEAISNHWNQILKDLEISGTFHRVRATFIVEIVREIYLRERAINGRAWQAISVLNLARQLLGHKDIDSLRPYLQDVMVEQMLHGDLVMVNSPNDAELIRGLSAALEGPDASFLREDLADFLAERGIEPVSEEARRYALI